MNTLDSLIKRLAMLPSPDMATLREAVSVSLLFLSIVIVGFLLFSL